MPELSIILPVYKMEKFLPRVIASIKAQTMRDFEAIFVDDGSPDNSGAICLASAADDSRFRVITRENGGVSKARNTALDAATGEYVMFVDPDDWIEPDAAEVLVGMAKNHNADIVLYGRHNDRYSSDGTFVGTSLSKPPITGVFTDEPFRTHFSALATSYFITDKLMKRSFIEEHHCRFPDMDLGEDGAFYISFYSADPSCLVATERAFYHYTVPESGSLSTSYHPERLKYAFVLSDMTRAAVAAWGLEASPTYMRTVNYCTVRDIMMLVKNTAMSGETPAAQRTTFAKVMRAEKLRKAVSETPLSMMYSRNDRIKLALLKMHMYSLALAVSRHNNRRNK